MSESVITVAGQRSTSIAGMLILSTVTTAAGTGIAYWVEQQAVLVTSPTFFQVTVGLIEEAFVRLIPLFVTFYFWSYHRGELLSKTEGLLAATVSGLTVSGLELIFKLQYLTQLERTIHLDALLAPIVFVHLPLALVAGRFAYALGEQIHGRQDIGLPRLSRRTFGYLAVGYFILVGIHVTYNATI